jgi:hypothetical protein
MDFESCHLRKFPSGPWQLSCFNSFFLFDIIVGVQDLREDGPSEFLTKKITFTNGLSKKTTYKKIVKKDPLLVATCLAN